MATEQEIGALIHAALQQAGYTPATTNNTPGYTVSVNKTFAWQPHEFMVSHAPNNDDPLAHTQAYFGALTANPALVGLKIEYVEQPHPLIYVRG